jgi:predicted enzyme related to lactoylglutathione lyase
MGERTSYPHGTFSWVDLATTDPEGAKEFYGRLFGWEGEDVPAGEGIVYTMYKLRGQDVAASSAQPDDERQAGIPPHWNSYVTVDDVDAVAARVAELGGKLLAPPFDVLEAGRMAVLQDPTGAVLCLWQPGTNIGAGLVNDPGSLTMNSLSTPDPEAARDFYTALLGWTFELGVGGSDYSSIRVGDRLNAGMQPETRMPAHWLPFFTVEDIDAAAATVRDGGGRVLVEPSAVPAGRFAVFSDPAGAAFAIFEGEVDD